MKFKLLIILIGLFLINTEVLASEKILVTLNKCVDGDTAWVNYENTKIKIRFLGIDTPESTNKKEKYGDVASEFTCNHLMNAQNLMIEYDENSEKEDLYKRQLVWVFIDDELLQTKIIKNGLGKVAYIYGDYKYVNNLYEAEEYARKNHLKIWEKENKESNIPLYIAVGALIVVYLFVPKRYIKLLKLKKL